MVKKQLTFEVFKAALDKNWDLFNGNFKEERFEALLNEKNFQTSIEQRELLRIELKKKGFFEASRVNLQSPNAEEVLTSLIQQKNAQVSPHIVQRMIKQFPALSSFAFVAQDLKIASDIYESILLLPHTETEADLQTKGIYINGALPAHNEKSILCFKGTKPCLLKTLTVEESNRMDSILPIIQMNGRSISPFIIDMNIIESKNKKFVIMPFMPSTLDQLIIRDSNDVRLLYYHMRDALRNMHRKNIAHMDVKPSNICINSAGDFVLIDFGSATPFGTRSLSTKAYIPDDLDSNPARAVVDWWMLIATITERACECNKWGTGAENPTKEEALGYLNKVLPDVVLEVQPLLRE